MVYRNKNYVFSYTLSMECTVCLMWCDQISSSEDRQAAPKPIIITVDEVSGMSVAGYP